MNLALDITKKSNLDVNDSLSAFRGIPCQQNPYSFQVFYEFLQETRPDTIVEIGTGLGGFTYFLGICCKELGLTTSIYTFDINPVITTDKLKELGIKQSSEPMFLGNWKGVKSTLVELIQTPGKTIVLCDGGNKVKEVSLLSPYLKVGDFILTHDYAFNYHVFNTEIKGKLWNWLEITYTDIETVLKTNNLQPYKSEFFKNAVWFCMEKKI